MKGFRRSIIILGVAVIVGLAMVAPRTGAQPAPIIFFCTEALEPAVRELVAEFESTTGHSVKIEFANAGTNAQRVLRGDEADLVVVLPRQWENLRAQERINPSLRVVIGKVGIGVFVRKGDPRPQIDSLDAFKRSISNARAIAIRDPRQRSPVGTYMMALFDRLGIGSELQPKIVLTADRPYGAVVSGKADLGLSSLPEILASPGVDLVGPLPAEIQDFIIFTAAVPINAKQPATAKALLNFLVSPRAAPLFKAKGIEPG